MKKIIILIFTICILISGYLIVKQHKVKVSNSQSNEVKSLLSAKSVTDEKELDKQFTVVKETDNKMDTRINDKKSLDYVSELNDNFGNGVETNKNNIENNIENNISVNQTDPYNINHNELNILSRLIESEAGNEPYTGKLAVASVVENRMKEDGETMDAVIYKKGQFDGVNTRNFNIEPSDDSKKAALEVLQGHNVIPIAYFFADLKMCNPEFAKADKFIARIGNHWFFKK